jgi:Cu/Ag efflux protein CusF
MRSSRIILAALLTAAVLAPASAQQAKGPPQVLKRYHLTGRVVSITPTTRSLVIDAKAIPGYMSAMTMPYAVKDTAVLSTLKAGDQVRADVVVSGGGTWLENVKVGAVAPRDTAMANAGPSVDSVQIDERVDSMKIEGAVDSVKIDQRIDSMRVSPAVEPAVMTPASIDTSKVIIPRDSMRPPKDTVGFKPKAPIQ